MAESASAVIVPPRTITVVFPMTAPVLASVVVSVTKPGSTFAKPTTPLESVVVAPVAIRDASILVATPQRVLEALRLPPWRVFRRGDRRGRHRREPGVRTGPEQA